MLKKILSLILILLPLTNCSSFNELNERLKGDDFPYIPGI